MGHLVTPRTLLFLERGGRWLFIQGAEHKWWAGRLNGVGGSVEADEGIRRAAMREAEEETGLRPIDLELAAIVHVLGDPAVLLFVFLGRLPVGALRPCDEGTFRWLSREEISDPSLPLMPDLPFLLPRLWAREPGSEPLFFHFDFSDGFSVVEE
ncbi:MAG: NUDIX domain-containing protein [Chloroflexota bacterium]|nr:NUDIX domain-containing protein [Chloroflexota bacterium]